MLPDVVLGLGIFAVVFLTLLALHQEPRRLATAIDDLDPARRYVDQQIDEHIEELIERYERARAGGGAPDRFAEAIEAFIGEVLTRAAERAHEDDLDLCVRELVVLEREFIYRRILARVGADPELLRDPDE